jgi:hypothetical protein
MLGLFMFCYVNWENTHQPAHLTSKNISLFLYPEIKLFVNITHLRLCKDANRVW